MTSTFGWLDTDRSQQQRMLEIVDLFKEKGTVDDLGIGQVRDGISDLLFPGSSTIQTRLRYALFVPWLLREAARERTATQMQNRMRNLEFRLIDALTRGEAGDGIIGASAGRNLKRLPSSVYWGMLGSWGIRTEDFSQGAFFTRVEHAAALARSTPISDDPESRPPLIAAGLDPGLPAPPEGFLDVTNFRLRAGEAQYLADKITGHHPQSLLAWLVHNPPQSIPVADIEFLWELPHLPGAPAELRTQVDHARRFHHAVHGANLLYNFLLAGLAGREELRQEYQGDIKAWVDLIQAQRVVTDWDLEEFWTVVSDQVRVRPATRAFLERWFTFLGEGADVMTEPVVHKLIEDRERRLKGPRSRFANPAALDRWSGGVGLAPPRFRWQNVRILLTDLYEGVSREPLT